MPTGPNGENAASNTGSGYSRISEGSLMLAPLSLNGKERDS